MKVMEYKSFKNVKNTGVLLIGLIMLLTVGSASAALTLGTAGDYAVLSNTGITVVPPVEINGH